MTLERLPVRSREDGSNCFVCGRDNQSGLRVRFRIEEDVCRGEFTPEPDHCGFEGVTHGGILFSLLDDVMANWLYLKGVRAYTARCDVRFRRPLPTGCRVRLEGRQVRQKRNVVMMEGIAIRADTAELVASCEANFVILQSIEESIGQ